MSKPMRVWIVEHKGRSTWSPCMTYGPTRADALETKHAMEQANPDDVFRVKPYRPDYDVKRDRAVRVKEPRHAR